jgi:hypothetical protein
MPNYVTNTLRIDGVSAERATEILDAVKDDALGRGSMDFNKIISMPDHIFRGNLGQKEREIYGKNNWYDWSCANWGTKWNAANHTDEPVAEGTTSTRFDTAWSYPEPAMQRLSEMFPDARFFCRWADEDIGANVGEHLWQDGELLDWDIPKSKSKEAYEMAADIMGAELSDYDLFYDEDIGNYRYMEQDEDMDEAEDLGMGGLT